MSPASKSASSIRGMGCTGKSRIRHTSVDGSTPAAFARSSGTNYQLAIPSGRCSPYKRASLRFRARKPCSGATLWVNTAHRLARVPLRYWSHVYGQDWYTIQRAHEYVLGKSPRHLNGLAFELSDITASQFARLRLLERIAIPCIAALEAATEPAHALSAGSMGIVRCVRMAEGVVANGVRGVEGLP